MLGCVLLVGAQVAAVFSDGLAPSANRCLGDTQKSLLAVCLQLLHIVQAQVLGCLRVIVGVCMGVEVGGGHCLSHLSLSS